MIYNGSSGVVSQQRLGTSWIIAHFCLWMTEHEASRQLTGPGPQWNVTTRIIKSLHDRSWAVRLFSQLIRSLSFSEDRLEKLSK